MILACFMLLLAANQALAREPKEVTPVSANIPLDSYIYGYLDKFIGLGYLDDIPEGTKPYSRMRAARWVQQIKENLTEDEAPAFALGMLAELEKEFAKELAILENNEHKSQLLLRSVTLETAYDDGPTLGQHRTASHYQPLNTYNDGYRLAEELNQTLAFGVEANLADTFLVSLTPRIDANDDDSTFSFQSAYLKTKLGGMEIFYGKDAITWGQGYRGNLLITNQSTPQTMLKLSTVEPLQLYGILGFLGQTDLTFFYTAPESDRSDVKDVNQTGLRLSFRPTTNFTFSLAGSALLGGDGHEFRLGDLFDLIRGKNAETAAGDRWDSIAGLDFCWRIPSLHQLQIFGEYYGEDQAGRIIPVPSKNAYLIGFYLPKLNAQGDWDLRFETARTTNVWYNHGLYTDGFTYRDNLIGDAMGNNATRYAFDLTHYFDDAQLGFHVERAVMDDDLSHPQTINAFWLDYRRHIWGDLELNTMAGWAQVENVGYMDGESDHNYLISVGLTKNF